MSTSTRIKRVIPVALYTVFYLLCFSYLENRHVRYHIIDSSLDVMTYLSPTFIAL